MKETLERRRSRILWWRHRLVLLLILEGLIALILHPQWTGVPILEQALATIAQFFHNLLWPHGDDDHSYRMAVYQAVVWVETLPCFPVLRVVAVYGIPLGVLASIPASIVTKYRLKNPDKPKNRKQPDTEKAHAAPVISRSGPSALWRSETKRRLLEVQARCNDDFFAGYGPFLHVHRVSESDELASDRVLDLSEGEARLPYQLGDTELSIEFYCQAGQPVLRCEDTTLPLKAGVPFQVLSDSRGSEGIVQYQITWLDQKEVRTC